MTSLAVRRLLVDLKTPFARHWNGGDAFRSAFFNALSMSFPSGEQFFIDAVRFGMKQLPEAERARFEPEVQGFIGQEATHRRIHALFNDQLAAQGHVNAWEQRVTQRLRQLQGVDARHWLGITAATEHFTAILAEYLLAQPSALAGAEPRLRTMWLWHSAEESEHRSTAFDLYRALGGDERWRRHWFFVVSLNFVLDVLRQTARNLRHDGQLWAWRSWRSGARFFFGRAGLVRHGFAAWRGYRRADFHPSKQGGELGLQWLRANAREFSVVGAASA